MLYSLSSVNLKLDHRACWVGRRSAARDFSQNHFFSFCCRFCDIFLPFYVTIIFRCVWCLVRFPRISRYVVLNVGCKLWAKNSLESTSSWNFSLVFNDPKNSFEWKWNFLMLSQASSMTEGKSGVGCGFEDQKLPTCPVEHCANFFYVTSLRLS